ncbi:hypothetical protein AAG570_006712 [Ranatra chinensis]|uniref:Fe2OG dioxygenase domain-containing protein n=1 Tax=Ranatra chinensis TaxID=642074 RepID=A0ABD0YUU7_9HEMI
MGYHHNWDTKVYSEEEKDEVPNELVDLCKFISGIIENDWHYEAQAVIINYYYKGSTLSGHTDHSEPNKTSPIISLSLGQSAVFLIGGRTLEDETTALLIRSGDIMVMSEESRLCYHAVPRIVPADDSPWSSGEDYNNHIDHLLKNCRINLNARQVLQLGQESLAIKK